MKTYEKTAIKKLYDYAYKTMSKMRKQKIKFTPECEVTVTYCLYMDGDDLEYDVDDFTAKVSGSLKEFMKKIGRDQSDIDDMFYNVDFSDYIDLRNIKKELDALIKAANLTYEDDDDYTFFLNYLGSYDFETAWKSYEISLKEEKNQVKLNSSYSASIDKKKGVVRVGCQTFPIEKVRAIVELFDKA